MKKGSARSEHGLEDLFLERLKDIYYAERKIRVALPKMAKAAHSEELGAAFEKHVTETEGRVERLKQIFKIMGETAKVNLPGHPGIGRGGRRGHGGV